MGFSLCNLLLDETRPVKAKIADLAPCHLPNGRGLALTPNLIGGKKHRCLCDLIGGKKHVEPCSTSCHPKMSPTSPMSLAVKLPSSKAPFGFAHPAETKTSPVPGRLLSSLCTHPRNCQKPTETHVEHVDSTVAIHVFTFYSFPQFHEGLEVAMVFV